MSNKRIPQRTCIICRTLRAKRELMRVVALSANHLEIDRTGKKNGRGAYVCQQRACWDGVLENPTRLSSALKLQAPIAADDLARLREFAATLPQHVADRETAEAN